MKNFAERLREEGIEEGMGKGMKKAELDTMKRSIRMTLYSKFNVSDIDLLKKIENIEDVVMLEILFNKVLEAKKLEDFTRLLEKWLTVMTQ